MDANLITAIFGLVGTLIGGLTTFFITKASNGFQLQREKEQWQRTREDKRDEWQRKHEEEIEQYERGQKDKKNQEYREIIGNCVKFLSLHNAEFEKSKAHPYNPDKYMSEAVKWVTEYSLLHVEKSEKIRKDIYNFLTNPQKMELIPALLVDFINLYNQDR